jgi:hypothetical protein
VTDDVRTDPFPCQRWEPLAGLLRMSLDQRMDSEASYRSAVAIQENKAVLRPACDQRSQNGHRSWPERVFLSLLNWAGLLVQLMDGLGFSGSRPSTAQHISP